MSALVVFPTASNAFSRYRPSSNAHTDFLSPNALGKRRQVGPNGDQGSNRQIKLDLGMQLSSGSRPKDDKLEQLYSAITLILAGKRTSLSYHALSATCHELVLGPNNQGPSIYARVKQELEASVTALAREWRGSIMGRESGWLDRLVSGWRGWEKKVALLASIFVYLDRVHATEANGVEPIKDLAITVFRSGIWENNILLSKTRDDFLSWVAAERKNGAPDTSARPTIISLIALSDHLSTTSTLTVPYLEQLDSHYGAAALEYLEAVRAGSMTATKYAQWTCDTHRDEVKRAEIFPDVKFWTTISRTMRTQTGERGKDQVMRKALDEGMESDDGPILLRLWQFCLLSDGTQELNRAMRGHVEESLIKIISDPANDPQMIDSTLQLRRSAAKALNSMFPPNPVEQTIEYLQECRLELEDAVRVGLKAGMNSRQNAPAEWIAKHLDSVMRKGQGSGTEAEFDSLLDEIIALIGFTRDKDVFKAFYSSGLAKRLLLNKSASDDMERTMIIKLQKEMGEEFTSGDVMMKDLTLSETLVRAYQSAQARNPDDFKDAGNFTANVLTESAWPAYPALKDGWNFKLTPQLQSSIDQFTKWYATQHKNRQLSWRWQLATVSLTARFPSGRYEVGVSLFQAVALLQYNEEDSLTFKELRDRTGIEHSELVRTVQSLSLGRKGTRVLAKKPPGKEVTDTDVFAWNKAFQSEKMKFRINQIQQDMSVEESKKTNEQVAIDRVSVLEATIVRIMKAKKKMTLQLLIDAVVGDVSKRFPPDVKEIKKRVESLIEREFLMRDEDDRNMLQYLA